jgi:hypothetical protein
MADIESNMEHALGLPHSVNMVTALQSILKSYKTFHITGRSTLVAGYVIVSDYQENTKSGAFLVAPNVGLSPCRVYVVSLNY